MINKRGIRLFSNRNGISHDLFFNVFELVLAFIVILALFQFLTDVIEQTIFEKNFLARDLSVLVNTLYAAPGKVVYNYNEDLDSFILNFEESKIKVFEIDEAEEDVTTFYLFAENDEVPFKENKLNVDAGKIEIGFVKSKSNIIVKKTAAIPSLASPSNGKITSKATDLIVVSISATAYQFYARKETETKDTASHKSCSPDNKQLLTLSYNTNYFWSANSCLDSSCNDCGIYASERSFMTEHVATESADGEAYSRGWTTSADFITTDNMDKQVGDVSIKISHRKGRKGREMSGKTISYYFESPINSRGGITFQIKAKDGVFITVRLRDSSLEWVTTKQIESAKTWKSYTFTQNDFELTPASTSFAWDKTTVISITGRGKFKDLWIDGLFIIK